MKWLYILLVSCVLVYADEKQNFAFVGNPLARAYPCEGNTKVSAEFESGQPPGEENKYSIFIQERLVTHSRVFVRFDSEASVTLGDRSSARISSSHNGVFTIHFFKTAQFLSLNIKGPSTGTMPYITSLNINNVEYCKKPQVGFFDSLIEGYKDTATVELAVPDDSCGRRKVDHTELITNGLETKPGDWPWHAALYKLDRSVIKYICGGTLVSKNFVLTAAHCVTIRGVPTLPEILSVVLGKYNLIGGDTASQEREVHQIIPHENFNHTNLDNDIAFLKLTSEAVYGDFVQPACIWNTEAYKKLPTNRVFGTVVGWGFDQLNTLSAQLRQATMPIVSESTCIKSKPLFYSRLLTDRKFCAGYKNGTSACNGDSGGGFVVFVPDVPKDESVNASGTWHVRGIVSLSVARRDVAICDPYEYVLFTDIAKYKSWLTTYLKPKQS